jgi:hypothetical protein
MRRQQEIYNQTGYGVRNRDHLNVNMSSDICQFNSPLFTVSGATKIIDETKTFSFSGLSANTLLLSGISVAFSATSQSCFSGATWSTKIVSDDNIIAENFFFSSGQLTGNTPSISSIMSSISTSLTSTGITHNYSGTTFNIDKPFGCKTLSIYTCINFGIDCHSGTTNITKYCTLGDSKTFTSINSGDTGVYIVDTATTIDVKFVFTGNTSSFTGNNATFKYEVYKYNPTSRVFVTPASYTSRNFNFVEFSGVSSNILNESISISNLNLDGNYLIKGYYEYDMCTDYMNKLGVKGDTSYYKKGEEYSLYNSKLDSYFIAINKADKPTFLTSQNNVNVGLLIGFTIFPSFSGQTGFTITQNHVGDAIVALNGLVLAENYDYTYSANTLNFLSATELTDVITIVFIADETTPGLTSEVINVNIDIPSGTTNNQGSNTFYYNTTTGKYEIYLSSTPQNPNDIVVSINGAVLANNIDYYQSTSNTKRIILNGALSYGDIITVYYIALTDVIGNIYTNTPTITWSIATPPKTDGLFTLQLAQSTDTVFSNIISSATTAYVTNQTLYNAQLTITGGTVGEKFIYRIKNQKDYVSLTGDKIISIDYSDTIPITIQSNAINSY